MGVGCGMEEVPRPSRHARFADFEVDLEAGELRKQGLKTKLPRQPFQVLTALLKRPGRVVRKEELREIIWPNNTAAEFERGIDDAVERLREVLNDPPESPRFLEVLPGHGYRFIHPVESPHDEGPPQAGAPDQVPATQYQPPSRELIGSLASHYRIHEEVDSGGMGIVYKARDTKLPRWVALKFLPPELATNPTALRRFEREARTASSLNHPNICTIYDVDQHHGRPFIVMELLEGETLRDHLIERPLSVGEIVKISSQVACALEAAHGKRIIHRDIKPANIFITREGLTKVLDFGLAKPIMGSVNAADIAETNLSTSEGANGPVTASGDAVGTVAYMSPEQLRGEKLDSRTDLFSFGAVLY